MYYKIDNNGFYLGIASDSNEDMEFYTEINPIGNFLVFRFNGNTWEEGATVEQIELNIESKKEQAKILLSETDWYVTRLIETGKPIPNEILEQRRIIRNL